MLARRTRGETVARVVLAEDDRQLLAFFGTVLEMAGHTVVRCRTGQAAITTVHAGGADIVITDLAMPPGLDGWGVINQLKSDPSTADIPIMVVTVRDDLTPNLPGVVNVLTN